MCTEKMLKIRCVKYCETNNTGFPIYLSSSSTLNLKMYDLLFRSMTPTTLKYSGTQVMRTLSEHGLESV